MFALLFFWFALTIAVALFAARRGRSAVGWALVSLLFSPLIAFIFLLIVPDRSPQSAMPTPETHVKCPDCRELVLRDARKCKHCGCSLVPQ